MIELGLFKGVWRPPMQSICRQNGQLWQVSYFESQLEKKKKNLVQKHREVEGVAALMDLGFS